MHITLHIGTHKTGTSSIQNYCALNAERLLQDGLCYGFHKSLSGRNANYLGARLACGRLDVFKTLMEQLCENARRARADNLLISAETFFGMSTFFPTFGAVSEDSYWALEQEKIEALKSVLPDGDVSIVCYVRRQDQFAESLYNQMVKQQQGYSGTFDQFVHDARFLLDYDEHLAIWADVFGADAVAVRFYEEGVDVVADFLNAVLNLNWVLPELKERRAVNTKLPPDILEFKRELNGRDMDPVTRLFAYRAVAQMAAGQPVEPVGLISSERRAEIAEMVRPLNEALLQRWAIEGGDGLLAVANSDESGRSLFAGLSDARRGELTAQYRKIMRRPTAVAQIALRRLFRACEARIPVSRHLVHGLRRLSYAHQTKAEIK